MVIVLLRTKLRPDADRAAYDATGAHMFELVQKMPGFLGADELTAADGTSVGIVRFASLEALRAWREHPEHVVTQQRGKTEFYSTYTIEICEVVRSYDFHSA
jgi:heme-degrading monooxygenase HmoA